MLSITISEPNFRPHKDFRKLKEIREIFGGFNFRPILSDGSILNLH